MGSVVEFTFRCCICGKRLRKREGNNPHPVKEDGICCRDCNNDVVIPARIKAFQEQRT
jgi:hypothetical protein